MEYGEARTSRESSETLYCNFCGKSQREVAKLIAGPRVCVCNECVALIVQILNEPDKEGVIEPLLVLKDFKPVPFHMPGAKLLEEVFGAEGPQDLSAMAMLAKLAVALQIRWERALGREGDLIAQLRELQGRENKLAPEVTGLREALETKELLLTEVREQIHTLQGELRA